MATSMFKVNTFIKINPTVQCPYELEYEIEIFDEGFKKRLKMLQDMDFKVVILENLFKYKITLMRRLFLSTSFKNIPPFHDLYLVDTPAIIRFSTKKEAEKFNLKFNDCLREALNYEQEQYIKLRQEAN
ncbi:hypothetical protein ACOMCU_25165 [Lysinibacillus sp. UGB7]|uniref:hypothetical protein n=1 Tax=Lysinibacillus sp. UGB7 TaxID=3411039 RepID=UPI003B77AE4A